MANFNLDNYIPVNARLDLFYKDFPEGRILTELIEHNTETGFVMFKAYAYRSPSDAQPSATGHAFEERNAGYVNKTSYIENCETSAVGRALALLGYEITKGIASREEMEKVKRHEGNAKQSQPKPQPTIQERIRNAQAAINDLGGKVEPFLFDGKTDAELQAELDTLSQQYKRLKNNK